MSETNVSIKQTNASDVKGLRKRDLLKSFWLWITCTESCYNYERLQSLGFCTSMIPILKRLYPNKEDLSEGLTRHLSFFNTEENFGAIIPGMVASLEEEKANGGNVTNETINALKTSLMGPLAGIGDTITQGLVKVILLSIGVNLALQGNVLGPILFLLAYTTYIIGTSYFMYFQGYKLGKNAFGKIAGTNVMHKLTDCMNILGITVAGSLVATTINISTPFVIKYDQSVVEIQSLFDQIMPGMLNLIAVGLVLYFLNKKGVSVIKIMLGIIVVGIICATLGIL